MKDVGTFLSAPQWDDFVIAPYGDLANATTDELKLEYVRTYGSNINHPVGTSRMSPKKARWGVVDESLLLKGAEGVRIVDASVFVSDFILKRNGLLTTHSYSLQYPNAIPKLLYTW